MTKTTRKLAPRRGKILIALFAAIAALSAGAEAFAPAPAAAEIADGGCAVDWFGVCVTGDTAGSGGAQGDSQSSGDTDPTTTDSGSADGASGTPRPQDRAEPPSGPLYCTSAPSPEESSCSLEPPKQDTPKFHGDAWRSSDSQNRNQDSGNRFHSAQSGSRGVWARFKRWVQSVNKDWVCENLRDNIKGRIRWIYDKQGDFDWVVNSGDDLLETYQARWIDSHCEEDE